ncbi:IS1/IS1595 family N-terminal zinc-binding domain-containing protein [Capnocytophaga canimorsus]|uniref:IS1/IS1595 family N-terminal zinc-binding domain-containing protein n=1 Tax=Capnocytophaga canimorsus TaxID=28188 RepID=UPI0037D08FB8
MKCTRCESLNKIKSGFVGGRQRYKCKDCGYFFSVEKKSDVKTPEQKRLALQMYLDGLGFRAIGRILNISYGTVYREGYNSRIRHYLARFKRKGKCYSKSKTMLENSLKLLFLKLNNQLNIII